MWCFPGFGAYHEERSEGYAPLAIDRRCYCPNILELDGHGHGLEVEIVIKEHSIILWRIRLCAQRVTCKHECNCANLLI